MTNNKAVEALKYLKHHIVADSEEDEAIDLAITALQEFDRMKLICASEGIVVYKLQENKA